MFFSWNSWLFPHRFSHRFFHRFLMENGSQNGWSRIDAARPFCSLFMILFFMLILCWIWLTLGALWPPFGSLLAPAGSLLAPFWLPLAPFGVLLAHFWLPLAHFWLPLAHFWLPLAPFWLTFGVPWLTFGALSFSFAHPGIHFLTFAVSCRHFSYLFEFSMKISCKIWFLNHFLWKSHSRSIKSYFPEAHRTHPNRKYPPFKGPERNICRRQLRSAPGPWAPEACLDLVWVPFQELI